MKKRYDYDDDDDDDKYRRINSPLQWDNAR